MNHTSINDDLRAALTPFMRKLPEGHAITNTTSLTKDLKIDSADMIDLILDIEERFSVKVEDEHIASVKTFGDLMSLVDSLRSANG